MSASTDKANEPQDIMVWALGQDKSLRELLTDKDAELAKKGNVLTINLGSKTITIMDSDPANNGAPTDVSSPSGAGAPSTEVQHTEPRRRRIPFSHMAAEIEKLRKEGLTQKEVAQRLGTTQANVSRIERAAQKAREEETQEAAQPATESSPASDA